MKNVFTPPYAALLGSLSLAALSLAFCAPAQAIIWNWTFTQTNSGTLNSSNGSGTFTTTNTPAGGPFTITAITGSFDNLGNITTLLAPDTILFNDNTITSSGNLSGLGVGFQIGGLNYNMYFSNPNTTMRSLNGGVLKVSGGTFSASPTPVPFESDALPLVGATLFMAGGLWWKKKRAQAKVKDFVATK